MAQPGIKNGAEHVHDFAGNLAITADTPDAALAVSGTTCRDGDRSAYFWPVVRIDESVRAGGDPGAGGAAPTVSCPDVASSLPAVPASVSRPVKQLLAKLDRLTAAANARLGGGRGRVDARLNNAVLASLRAERATGDAKPTSRGPANARAAWTCAGFADRLSDQYPICPPGADVLRVHDFPGCWDGKNIDSENHRSHVPFADQRTGACPAGFGAIPQLRVTIAYDIPHRVQEVGQYALDSFPEENHNPFSDHDDFVYVNSDRQMQKIAACVNAGRRCS